MTSGFGAHTTTISTAGNTTLLAIRHLHVTIPSETGQVRAAPGLDFDVRQGEVHGLTGSDVRDAPDDSARRHRRQARPSNQP